MDFSRKEDVVDVDYRIMEGVPLESMDSCQGFKCKAVMKRGWSRWYYLIPRATWEKADYLKFADKRLAEIGIKNP
jgi:hypothetical protein